MTEWQDIKTAPKDADILLYASITNEQFVAFWGTCIEDCDGAWVFARSPGVSFIVRNPTHWMPLPAPPSQEEAP